LNIEEKYKQALRGLFTSGTSPSLLNRENSGKGRQQTGIESELQKSKDENQRLGVASSSDVLRTRRGA